MTQSELDQLFDALGFWEKVRDGRFSSVDIPRARRPSYDPVGGTSEIVRHFNHLGYQVATSHRITMPNGDIPHWDSKDIRVGDIVVFAR